MDHSTNHSSNLLTVPNYSNDNDSKQIAVSDSDTRF